MPVGIWVWWCLMLGMFWFLSSAPNIGLYYWGIFPKTSVLKHQTYIRYCIFAHFKNYATTCLSKCFFLFCSVWVHQMRALISCSCIPIWYPTNAQGVVLEYVLTFHGRRGKIDSVLRVNWCETFETQTETILLYVCFFFHVSSECLCILCPPSTPTTVPGGHTKYKHWISKSHTRTRKTLCNIIRYIANWN